MRSIPRGRMLALILTTGFGIALAPAAQASVSSTSTIALNFDDATPGALVTTTSNLGTAPVSTSVVTSNGGSALGAASLANQGTAVQFPTFDSSRSGPRAVISIRNSGPDLMNPGDRDFSWGADFSIDATSYSHAIGSFDNGDNLVQRGLARSQAQFKLQLDNHQPSCRIATPMGNLLVIVPVSVTPGVWYNATCTRSGTVLTASLTQYDETGNRVQTWTRSATKTLGPLTWSDPLVPLSVGGKLSTTGALVPATDQFNGLVDNAFVTIQG